MCRAPLKISLLSGLPVEILQLELQLQLQFVNLTLTLKLKLSLKVNLVPYQKSWDTKPINCVGVQTFRIEIHKC